MPGWPQAYVAQDGLQNPILCTPHVSTSKVLGVEVCTSTLSSSLWSFEIQSCYVANAGINSLSSLSVPQRLGSFVCAAMPPTGWVCMHCHAWLGSYVCTAMPGCRVLCVLLCLVGTGLSHEAFKLQSPGFPGCQVEVEVASCLVDRESCPRTTTAFIRT